MGQWRSLSEELQTHRIMVLVTDSPIPFLENLTGSNSPSNRYLSFVPLPPKSETLGDTSLMIEPLITTIPALLNLEDLVTKLLSKHFRRFLIELKTLPTPQQNKTLRNC